LAKKKNSRNDSGKYQATWGQKMNIPITIDEEGNPKDIWPELHETITHAEVNKNSVSSTVPDEHHHLTRTSLRPKRTPVTRHEDFLW